MIQISIEATQALLRKARVRFEDGDDEIGLVLGALADLDIIVDYRLEGRRLVTSESEKIL